MAQPNPQLSAEQLLARHTAQIEELAKRTDTPKAQYWYVYGCLDSKIQALILPTATAGANVGPDLILTALARVYDDPNRASRAAERLTKINQFSDESFTAFLARFERILYEAGAQDWPDLARISALRNGLGPNLMKKLDVQITVPDKYNDFVKVLNQLAGGSRFTAPSSTHGHQGNGGHGSGFQRHHSPANFGGTKVEDGAIGVVEAPIPSMKALLFADTDDECDN
jgi:hypothetical protein